ncbi:hypothetical protein [Mycobacterium sp. SMC-4]|uniref:hypothetical protein n=1 Tax=Mycobacterium sp. SMC-4 TaxID=2857059 RepID=UPI003CFBEB72
MAKVRIRVPSHLFRGRVRTSTVALVVAFIALFAVQQNYEPPEKPLPPPQQMVPPGFVPDPDYTWVPRTNVQTREPETTTTRTTTTTPTTTTTTTTTPTTTTSPSPDPANPTVPGIPSEPTTTVIDPDGRGPLGPQTFVQSPPADPTEEPAPPLFPGVVPPPAPVAP